MIRLQVPDITEDDIEAVAEVLRSGSLVQGPRVQEFEAAVAEYVGVGEAVAVSSGTAALHLALLALGVGPGDLVVTTAYSFPATANVIALCGARPVFVDVREDSFNIDPEGVRRVVQDLSDRGELSQVKAILPVHAFGLMADMGALLAIAEQYSIPTVEDAACALGAHTQGRAAGAWGVMGCFSFHPRKVITTGEGGMITTDDADLARKLRVLRNHGQDVRGRTPEFVRPGFNYRMTDPAAALGYGQLQRLESRRSSLRSILSLYSDRLARVAPMVHPQSGLDLESHAMQALVLRLPCDSADERDSVIDGMRTMGIEATIGTYAIPETTQIRCTENAWAAECTVAKRLGETSVAIPLHTSLTSEEIARVVDALAASLLAVAELREV